MMRLRMNRPIEPFHIVLVEPEIPQNTGNISRLCAATGSTLHLVGTLGFSTDDKAVRRAGLDYWHLVKVMKHPNLETCLSQIDCQTPLLFTTKRERCYLEAPFQPGQALIFGSESKGLSPAILDSHPDGLFGIPTVSSTVRSLNLANAASIIVYEGLRVTGAMNTHGLEPTPSKS